MPKFIIKTGKYQGKKLKLPDRDITVGRDLECDIRVSDTDVSRMHCQIKIRDGKLFVDDLESRNGTFINDIAIETETPLQTGDQLRIGPMVFELAGTKTRIKKPSNLEPDKAAPLSDDDISSWLSEEVSEEEASSAGDTTVIPTSNIPPTGVPPAPKPPKKKEYHSVAEEAADIIKKHWERVAQQKQESE
ncbi:FHA domain-containing protein [Gimesia fumaroli]|uniref:Oxoglutarate dehydrogenase inhibitor n=1 Tax=Gimesia fumaroli TaxID=2527976 RepID=A0A518I6Q9_9PLAN|nr:FHA domain-containing protein [Gimesia fumaroli]QDV48749.1 Oxoglutarate dehydrogenase inhibitor [Gimesia fumaroli]